MYMCIIHVRMPHPRPVILLNHAVPYAPHLMVQICAVIRERAVHFASCMLLRIIISLFKRPDCSTHTVYILLLRFSIVHYYFNCEQVVFTEKKMPLVAHYLLHSAVGTSTELLRHYYPVEV